MAIVAKHIDKNNKIESISLSDDPSDIEIYDAAGGVEDTVRSVLIVENWEVFNVRNTENFLIVGAPPFIHAVIKKRQSCELRDDQLLAIKKLAQYHILHPLPL